MTTGQQGRQNLGAQLIEWFWQSSLATQLATWRAMCTPRGSEFVRRARLSAAVAQRLAPSSTAERDGSVLPIVHELYRQGVYWALAACHENAAPEEKGAQELGGLPEFDELWRWGKWTVLREAPGNSDQLWRELAQRSFRDFYESPSSGEEKLASWSALLASLIRQAEPSVAAYEELWCRRMLRIGLPAILLIVLAVAGGVAWDQAAVSHETSMSWRTSSVFPLEKSCSSPSQICAEPRFFFCTQYEQGPWIEFDLGSKTSISSVHVENRTDCSGCPERAIPLLVEVSTDRKTWSEVARKGESFEEWTARFKATDARWVRLRVPRISFLHLKRVRIPF